ncbi:MAG: biotin--[acetyl-CoA-carboxylase] ligase [Nitrospinae bacterium]|nr:biotin--[acetyl-CoA-carboxylase] ligase [Nitrospinota bacterium]
MFNTQRYLDRLQTREMGRAPVALDEVDSTNDWISQRLATRQAAMMVAVAEKQTMGRGRRGREWISRPFVNLAASVAWPTPQDTSPGLITLSAGVALAEAVVEATGLPTGLKYPNDLMIRGKKAGGILTERKTVNSAVWAVIGFGVNVNTEEWMFPETLQGSATSLMMENGGMPVSREELLAATLTKLEAMLDGLGRGGSKKSMIRYKILSTTIGHAITVTEGRETITGNAVDMGDDGSLVIMTAPGVYRSVMTGEAQTGAHTFRIVEET